MGCLQDKTSATINAYNKNHHNYTDKFMHYGPYVTHVLQFADLLENGFKVLDVGCGPGNVTKQLCDLKKLVITGIDLSPEVLETARNNVPGGMFLLQDIRSASFVASSYDAVILSFSIVHLDDDEAYIVLANAVKWLRSGGCLYLSFMEGKQTGFERTSFSSEPIYFNYFIGSKIERFLEECGVECIHNVRQDYLEPDGTTTIDVFIFGKKI